MELKIALINISFCHCSCTFSKSYWGVNLFQPVKIAWGSLAKISVTWRNVTLGYVYATPDSSCAGTKNKEWNPDLTIVDLTIFPI